MACSSPVSPAATPLTPLPPARPQNSAVYARAWRRGGAGRRAVRRAAAAPVAQARGLRHLPGAPARMEDGCQWKGRVACHPRGARLGPRKDAYCALPRLPFTSARASRSKAHHFPCPWPRQDDAELVEGANFTGPWPKVPVDADVVLLRPGTVLESEPVCDETSVRVRIEKACRQCIWCGPDSVARRTLPSLILSPPPLLPPPTPSWPRGATAWSAI